MNSRPTGDGLVGLITMEIKVQAAIPTKTCGFQTSCTAAGLGFMNSVVMAVMYE